MLEAINSMQPRHTDFSVNPTDLETMAAACSLSRTFVNGTVMPQLGLGTWELRKSQETKIAVLAALKAGYRLIDTAQYYGNESEIGCALQESELEREDYFIVTKLIKTNHGYASAKEKLKESLNKLQMKYVDLYLIHNPVGGKIVETWHAFEDLKSEGLAKNIGVSNFNVHHLEHLQAAGCRELPSINQIEAHPWLQQKVVTQYCIERDIGIMAYCPLARGVYFEDGACPTLDAIASKYGKTKAQVTLRWALQKGYVVVPKSSKEERIIENSLVFDFEVSDNDIAQLDALECDRRVCIDAILSPWTG